MVSKQVKVGLKCWLLPRFSTRFSWCFDDRSRSETCHMNSPSCIVLFILLYTVFLVEVSYKNPKLKFSP